MSEPMKSLSPHRALRHLRSPLAPLLAIAIIGALLLLQRATPAAHAQNQGQPPRARGEYTLLSGRLTIDGPHAVYVLDSSNQELVALRWDQSRQMLMGIGYRNLSTDTSAQIGR